MHCYTHDLSTHIPSIPIHATYTLGVCNLYTRIFNGPQANTYEFVFQIPHIRATYIDT